MPRYQIILDSDAVMPDDEFRQYAERGFNTAMFTIVEARTIDDLRDGVVQYAGGLTPRRTMVQHSEPAPDSFRGQSINFIVLDEEATQSFEDLL